MNNLEKFQRTIKFRVWNNKTKSWIHGPHKCDLHGPSCNSLDGVNLLGETILFGGFLDGVSIEDLNDIVTVQFTGLQDKNGHDIFEGDIIRVTGWYDNKTRTRGDYNVLIEWTETQASDDMGVNTIGFMRFDEYGMPEVIGNIFENPELIK